MDEKCKVNEESILQAVNSHNSTAMSITNNTTYEN